ncbi:MAG: NAD(P)H-hydrate dehydratase, partial [Pseudomonadota bacterium]|nr:NAD(P)H-hydrate dehydratase [Pseudomonadota bacterium]
TVLCGPGNNGGDGYVIARLLREHGLLVTIVAPLPPKTQAAIAAKEAWGSAVLTSGGGAEGEVFVDCLFGCGLSRPLSAEHSLLLRDLASRHSIHIAIDVPSGIESDSGKVMAERLPDADVTLALGAWKFAHWLSCSRSKIGDTKLVDIGISEVEGAALRITRPCLKAPAVDAHKYTRGLCTVVAGAMPGASLLSATAAMGAGAGYVKLLSSTKPDCVAPDLVCETGELAEGLSDKRISAILIGPGLGRDEEAKARLAKVIGAHKPTVLDADALHLLTPDQVLAEPPLIATPHDGELERLCRTFSVIADGRMERAKALAKVSGMVIVAKGPDTFIASPDGAVAIGPPAPSWLSVAGSGDLLAGTIASRLATGRPAFDAACEGLWLHTKAARIAGVAFRASDLAEALPSAIAAAI